MKSPNELQLEQALTVTRRQFFGGLGLGLGTLALNALVENDGYAQNRKSKIENRKSDAPLAPRPPMFAPKAKAVIYLHMAGSPSQLELFEYKPELVKFD